ncbi:MAG: (2Fe-2S) ferredoxin domain-containing protein [Gammaproteobacteria bacterium]|nr:MAG: (2Fe-2S) ferredoxin domain-containing protein [Gammaproteobacteria bacterium]
MSDEQYYKHHVFFCQNKREGKPCCEEYGASAMREYVKKRMKEAGLHGKDCIRINQAGCLGRCDDGPVLVVYPEGVWYHYIDKTDVDEIIEKHLLGGEIVERLVLKDSDLL